MEHQRDVNGLKCSAPVCRETYVTQRAGFVKLTCLYLVIRSGALARIIHGIWLEGRRRVSSDTQSYELGVTSRMIMRPFSEEVGALAMPVLEGLDRRSALEDSLRKLGVVEADVAQEGLLQLFA